MEGNNRRAVKPHNRNFPARVGRQESSVIKVKEPQIHERIGAYPFIPGRPPIRWPGDVAFVINLGDRNNHVLVASPQPDVIRIRSDLMQQSKAGSRHPCFPKCQDGDINVMANANAVESGEVNMKSWSRRSFVRDVGCASAGLAFSCLMRTPVFSASVRPPNFVLIYMDDMGYADPS